MRCSESCRGETLESGKSVSSATSVTDRAKSKLSAIQIGSSHTHHWTVSWESVDTMFICVDGPAFQPKKEAPYPPTAPAPPRRLWNPWNPLGKLLHPTRPIASCCPLRSDEAPVGKIDGPELPGPGEHGVRNHLPFRIRLSRRAICDKTHQTKTCVHVGGQNLSFTCGYCSK